MARFIFLIVLCLLATSARAAEYKPGTVGYLYEDCRHALADSVAITDLQKTYCGAFVEGYLGGYLAANWIVPTTSKDDPCLADKEKAFEHIEARTCENFPKPDQKNATAGEVLNAVTGTVTRWIDFEKEKSQSDPLKRGAMREVNNIIIPGPFCDSLAQSYPAQEPPFTLNPALTNINVSNYMKEAMEAKKGLSIKVKYERCKQDVANAAGDSKKFAASLCGAEISGYISGLHSTQNLQRNRPVPSKECKKQIDRLYKSLDVPAGMCVTYETDPLRVAEIFLKRYPEIEKPDNLIAGVGYMTILRGFLCADKTAEGN